MFSIKLTSLNDFPLEEGPTGQFKQEEGRIISIGQFKQSLDSFYVTDSPLSVTNTAQIAMLYI